MNPTLLCFTGNSATGKTTLKNKLVSDGLFYALRSATTRKMRVEEGESEGNPYFFRDEAYFDNEPLVTRLWVNEKTWQPGDKKWMYGVPESEVMNNLGKNLIYDVIQPCYIVQMIKWFHEHHLRSEYNIKIAWFIPPENGIDVISARANMKDDAKIRKMNTCTAHDLIKAGQELRKEYPSESLEPDFVLCPRDDIPSPRLQQYLLQLYGETDRRKALIEKECINHGIKR